MAVRVDFYDELETLVASRKSCEIAFNKDGGRSVIRGTVADLSDLGEDLFLTMESGLEIRLADIIEIDGKSQSNLC